MKWTKNKMYGENLETYLSCCIPYFVVAVACLKSFLS